MDDYTILPSPDEAPFDHSDDEYFTGRRRRQRKPPPRTSRAVTASESMNQIADFDFRFSVVIVFNIAWLSCSKHEITDKCLLPEVLYQFLLQSFSSDAPSPRLEASEAMNAPIDPDIKVGELLHNWTKYYHCSVTGTIVSTLPISVVTTSLFSSNFKECSESKTSHSRPSLVSMFVSTLTPTVSQPSSSLVTVEWLLVCEFQWVWNSSVRWETEWKKRTTRSPTKRRELKTSDFFVTS